MSPKPNDPMAGLGSILGGLLGGTPSRGGDLVGDILRKLTGSSSGTGAGGIEDSPLGNLVIQPIVDRLVEKTSLDPIMARKVVAFALTTLLSAATQKSGQKGLDLSDLVSQLSTRGTVSTSYLESSGLVNQLTQQSGLDQETAAKSLQQAFSALSTQAGTGSTQTRRVAPKRRLKKRKLT